MGEMRDQIEIARDAAAVWTIVGDPAAITQWFSGIASCTVDGDLRVCTLANAATINERIQAIDIESRTLTYSVIAGMPVESHLGTVRVVSLGNGHSRVEYVTQVEPESFERPLGESVHSALKNLKRLLEVAA